MAGIFQKAKDFLTYQEPKNEEHGFELSDGENEGQMNPSDSGAPGGKNNSAQQDNKNKQRSGGRDARQKKSRFSRQEKDDSTDEGSNEQCRPPKDPEFISDKLCDNIETIRQKFHMPRNQDIFITEFKIGWKLPACICYIEGMVDRNTINLSLYPPLMSREILNEIGRRCPIDVLIDSVLTIHKVRKSRQFTDLVLQMLSGASLLFIDGCSECAVIDTVGYKTRNIEQPVTEKVVKGSQEGFTENYRTNITMLRRIIKNENFIVETMTVGKADNNTIAITYHDEIADPRIVQEVKKRINRINADFVPGVGILEQYIEDNSFMLFPQTIATERPDRAASFIMEGQVVIFGEGTPFGLSVPVTFFRLLHSSEDTNARWIFGTFLRLVRIFGLFCATFLPGLYTAIVMFHPEVIPTELLISITQAKEPVPFPAIVEVLILEGSFELIREGGIRVPTAIGQTLGIVGAIILGQAAVTAGLVSPVVVIIVSITALGSFTIPNYELGLAIRIERFLFIAVGAILGIYGVSLLIFVLAILACSMKSFGVPFFSPVAPKTAASADIIVRKPIWAQKKRPDAAQSTNRQRQGDNVKNWSQE
ncbi:MAG: spore germination protein [Clostridiales bacterium]|nr:spore germination protein [Clostridiales bacterium]